jgi:hypothetical protein
MRLLIISALLTVCFTATGQTLWTKKSLTFYPGTYIDTENRYANSTGLSVIIQNSLSKWGGLLVDDSLGRTGYRDPLGNNFSCVIFWTRVINETDSALELNLNFSADSFAIQSLPGAYFKIFLPADTMTLGKEVEHSYGLTGLKSFLDSNFYKPTSLRRTIDPGGNCMFYVVLIDHFPNGTTPVTTRNTRAELVLKEHAFFYDINVNGSRLIPCGQISLNQTATNNRRLRKSKD